MKVEIVEAPKPEDQIVLTLTPDEAAVVAIALSGRVGDLGSKGIFDALEEFNGEESHFGCPLNVDPYDVAMYKMADELIKAVRRVRPNV